jgi:RNA polymerase sigma factor (sigma-70 family)
MGLSRLGSISRSLVAVSILVGNGVLPLSAAETLVEIAPPIHQAGAAEFTTEMPRDLSLGLHLLEPGLAVEPLDGAAAGGLETIAFPLDPVVEILPASRDISPAEELPAISGSRHPDEVRENIGQMTAGLRAITERAGPIAHASPETAFGLGGATEDVLTGEINDALAGSENSPVSLPVEPDSLQDLFLRSQQGDRAALEKLLRQIRPKVNSSAMKFTGNKTRADDITQIVLTRIWLRLMEGKIIWISTPHFWGLVYLMTRNAVVNIARQDRRFKLASRDDGGMKEFVGDGSDPEKLAQDRELLGNISTKLSRMNPADAAAIRLAAEEMSYSDAADALGITVTTLKSRLHNIRHRLKK